MSVFEGKADIPVDRALIGENTENPLRQGKEIIVLDLKTTKVGSRHRELRDSLIFPNRMRGVFRYVPADERAE